MKGWICEDYCIEYFQLIFDCHIHTGINRERIVCSLLNLSSVEIFSIQSDIDLGDLHAFLLECICYNYLFCSDVVTEFADSQFVLSFFANLIFCLIGFLNNVKGWSINWNISFSINRNVFFRICSDHVVDSSSCEIWVCNFYCIFKCQMSFSFKFQRIIITNLCSARVTSFFICSTKVNIHITMSFYKI